MFARKNRLPANQKLQNSTFYVTPLFSVKIAKNNIEDNRYGFVVSKKTERLATDRNSLKRRFRAILEGLHPTLPKGYDFLVILKSGAKEKTTEEMRTAIKDVILTKARIS
jgi:ribonuclease P protein component